VRQLAATAPTLDELMARQSVCRACPRLVTWREQVAAEKRRSSRDDTYWGRPVAGWGDERPRVLIVGLAPAAHGGNRTGRIFTGDRSGDVLFASLHRCGLAALPTSVRAGDGQRLLEVRMAAAVRCAPPVNKPSVTERDTCAPWLTAEFSLVAPWVRVIVSLGGFAWQSCWAMLRASGSVPPRPRPVFAHGAEVWAALPGRDSGRGGDGAGGGRRGAGGRKDGQPGTERRVLLLGCYHPSQQNTFTGRVTPGMLDAVFRRAREAAGLGSSGGPG
jgi:uracil-DNA glycosylase